MTPERYRQIVELCQTVWELVPEQRAEFLAKAVDGDGTLRRDVEALLAADQQSAAFLSDTPNDLAASAFHRDSHSWRWARRLANTRSAPVWVLVEWARSSLLRTCG